MLVGPGIEVKAIECHALRTDWDDGHPGPHVAVEAVLIHAEILRCIAESQQSWRENLARVHELPIDVGATFRGPPFSACQHLGRRVLTHDA